MHPYESWMIRRYLANALRTRRLANPPRFDSDLIEWVESFGASLGIPSLKLPREPRLGGRLVPSAERKAAWRAWRTRAIQAAAGGAPALSPLQRRIAWLAKACALSEAQTSMMALLARIADIDAAGALIGAVNERMAIEFDAPRLTELRLLLDPRLDSGDLWDEDQLIRLGLIESRDSLRLSGVVHRILSMKRLDGRNVGELLLGEPAAASLSWDDFAHLGEKRDLAARLIAAAEAGQNGLSFGVNILFYGLSGTGKTEFAKTLGARLGFSVQFVGEANDRQVEPRRSDRVAALIIANAVGGVARKTIVVVDEADDLFLGVDESDPDARRGSKVFMNRLVERAAAPTIWIANDADRLGEAVVRRMSLAIRFPTPALSVRKSMIARIAVKTGFPVNEDALSDLARHSAPPALIESAIGAAAAMGGSAKDASLVLEQGLAALGRKPKRSTLRTVFDPALNAADVDLLALAEKVASSRTRALSFCFSGPSGSGKSAYARYLAQRLGTEVMERRFSDLVSCFVGESEKAIAGAFEEAADLNAFLIIDEADSFLRDRREAYYSWEITLVNEMLTWMERHPAPFACTTNASDLIDGAAARRFLFKVRFSAMRSDQLASIYRTAFQADLPDKVARMGALTPGDVFNVAKRADLMGVRDSATIANWLQQEVASRGGETRRKIGF